MSSLSDTPEQGAPAPDIERYQLEERRRSGAHWFYWIAALSLITSFIMLAGGRWGFFLSLGITQLIDGIAIGVVEGGANSSVKVIAGVLDALAAGAFALFGYFSARGHNSAFLVGMALYALDALIFVTVGDWLPILFHALALYYIFSGYRAATQLQALAARQQTAHVAPVQ